MTISLQKRKFQKIYLHEASFVDLDFLHKQELFLVFIERKHKTDLDVTYFKGHSTIIKFPTLEMSTEWGGGLTYVSYDILRGIYLCCKV